PARQARHQDELPVPFGGFPTRETGRAFFKGEPIPERRLEPLALPNCWTRDRPQTDGQKTHVRGTEAGNARKDYSGPGSGARVVAAAGAVFGYSCHGAHRASEPDCDAGRAVFWCLELQWPLCERQADHLERVVFTHSGRTVARGRARGQSAFSL